MKPALALFCAAGACAAFVQPQRAPKSPTIIVTGETLGYLSPCGCTQPMTGGILRLGTEIRRLERAGPSLLVYTGGVVQHTSRQDVLKAEALSQALGSWNVTASNLAVSDAKLGSGELLSLNRLQKGRMVSASLAASPSNPLPPYFESHGFLFAGVSASGSRLAKLLDESPIALDGAMAGVLNRAMEAGERVVLLFDGGRTEAVSLANRYPSLTLIAYRSTASPPRELEKVGGVLLVTPGERGQDLVSLTLTQGAPAYSVKRLDPGVKDDPSTASIYRTYLDRLSQEHLWAKTPRLTGPSYADSARCGSCHREASQVWTRSAHARAFQTLAREGHGQDPECLPCHVVGGAVRSGFQSVSTTPGLASVGCESCHGPGNTHSENPRGARMPKVGSQSCIKCHEPLNSPRFDFSLYWAQIKHHL